MCRAIDLENLQLALSACAVPRISSLRPPDRPPKLPYARASEYLEVQAGLKQLHQDYDSDRLLQEDPEVWHGAFKLCSTVETIIPMPFHDALGQLKAALKERQGTN